MQQRTAVDGRTVGRAGWRRALGLALVAMALLGHGRATAEEAPAGRTPPRLSYLDGGVSFWRTGAEGWAAAQVNLPLAAGDQLYATGNGTFELQVAARAYVRAGAGTLLALDTLEPDFLQLRIPSGYASVDLRALPPGQTIELSTPHAAVTIEHPGYYRLDVDHGSTSVTVRRGGQAGVAPSGGAPTTAAHGSRVVVTGVPGQGVAVAAAPELDPWDQWNYERTTYLLSAASARYLSPDIYGGEELDRHGTWRVVETYGPVWFPRGIAPGWAPYSTGRWLWDPVYGWTWLDDAPWGWVPCHYGRWVRVGGAWAWAPGPVVVRPAYAPALVAFLGGPGPHVGWVALGWGEPLVPWWGPAGFVGVRWWGGWGGPRVAPPAPRHVVVPQAVVVVPRERFARDPVGPGRVRGADPRQLGPIQGLPPVKPAPGSLVPDGRRAAVPPPEALVTRGSVGTRPAEDPTPRLREQGLPTEGRRPPLAPRVIVPPARPGAGAATPPPSPGERPAPRGPRPRPGGPQPAPSGAPDEPARPGRRWAPAQAGSPVVAPETPGPGPSMRGVPRPGGQAPRPGAWMHGPGAEATAPQGGHATRTEASPWGASPRPGLQPSGISPGR